MTFPHKTLCFAGRIAPVAPNDQISYIWFTGFLTCDSAVKIKTNKWKIIATSYTWGTIQLSKHDYKRLLCISYWIKRPHFISSSCHFAFDF